ncbi:hypothetical protein ASE14_00400 [Agromyces sp. Root81]|nr:hypothetical protein ASE14_00400 [Agromyces sp. Root81]
MAALDAQTRTSDFTFISGISSSVLDTGLVFTNSTPIPIVSTAFWYVAFDGEKGVLREVEGEIAGVPACTSVLVPWAHLYAAEPNTRSIGGERGEFQRPPSAAEELHLALQAPSGSWFLAGASGTLLKIELSEVPDLGIHTDMPQEAWPSDSPRDVVAYPYGEQGLALSALHDADIYAGAPDTFWEGADLVETFTAESLVSVGNTVTGHPDARGAVLKKTDCQ